MTYAAYHSEWDLFVVGNTKKEIIDQVCKWKIDDERNLYAEFKYFKNRHYHSYSDMFTYDEMISDIINFLIGKMNEFGWTLYKIA